MNKTTACLALLALTASAPAAVADEPVRVREQRVALSEPQRPLIFGQQVLATSRTELAWPVTADVNWVRGPLTGVAAYTTDVSGSMADVISVSDGAQPAPGGGFYYLLQDSSCAVASWQSNDGSEPLRDSALP